MRHLANVDEVMKNSDKWMMVYAAWGQVRLDKVKLGQVCTARTPEITHKT